jgi:hypothetical protein
LSGAHGSLARKLARAGLLVIGLALVWAGASWIDLYDGSTWRKRSRHEDGPLFRPVDAAKNAQDFKLIVMLRGVMPVVLIGTAGAVLLLGAAGQNHVPRS